MRRTAFLPVRLGRSKRRRLGWFTAGHHQLESPLPGSYPRCMQPAEPFCLVLITVPNLETARLLAGKLVESRLAACVNILPSVESHYRWEGQVHRDPEILLIIKSKRERLAALEEVVLAAHPYDTPEILALPILEGTPRYLAWLTESVQAPAVPGAR